MSRRVAEAILVLMMGLDWMNQTLELRWEKNLI